MPVVRVIHWKATEAKPLLEACGKTGFEVEYLEGDGGAICRAIRSKPPDVLVIDLSRLPSHGREVAVWLRNTRSTRAIPIVFTGGEPSKVASVRQLLPDAAYADLDKLAALIKRLSKSAPKPAPVIPPPMERGQEKSAAQKLGIEPGATVSVIEPPTEFPAMLGDVPESVEFQKAVAPITLWFIHDRESLLTSLRRMRTVAGCSKLWLVWRKGSSGKALTQNVLRETTREVGLVDYRICAVDERWSAMLFTRKKA